MIEVTSPARGLLRDELTASARLAWPIALGGLAQMAINTVDVLILGRYSVDALAASAIGLNLMWAFVIFGIGVVVAVSPLVSAERGRRRHSVREVRRTVRQGLWLAVLLSLPMWLLLWNGAALLIVMGQDPDLVAAASRFIRIAMWGIMPFLLFIVLRSFVTALERPMTALAVTVAAVLFNIAACTVLVFGVGDWTGWGLNGAALANALSNLFLFVAMALVIVTDRRLRRFRIFGRWWRADWPRLGQLLALGIPIGVTLALEVTIFNASVFLMGMIGRPSLAAHAVAIQIASLTFQLPLGIAQAATVRVGLAHGRGDKVAVGRAGLAAILLGFAVAAALSLGMALLNQQLVALFLDPDTDADRIAFSLATQFMVIAALFQLFDATQTIGAGVLRGIQDTRWPMVIAAFGYWVVGFGIAIILAFRWRLQGLGVWIGLAVGLAIVAALMLLRWGLRERLGLVRYPTA
jgi:MATE family multidrug resistance protein